MRKSTAERAEVKALLDELLAEIKEQRALVLSLLVRTEGIGKMLDQPAPKCDDEPLHFHPQTGALTDEPVALVVPEPQSDMMKVSEAAAMLSVSEFTVRAMCADGRLAGTKKSNAVGWRITRESVLDEWNRRWG